jgi:hypothetical protein
MSDKDVDAQFADIIAHWNDAPVEPGRTPGPTAAEGTGDDDPAGPAPDVPGHDGTSRRTPPSPPTSPPLSPPTAPPLAPAPESTRPAPPRPPGPLPGSFRFQPPPGLPPADAEPVEPPASWRSPEPVEEHEEHFEPGPTAPLPAGDLQFWGILTGLVGGPLLLLFLVLFNREGNPLWMLLAVGLTVAGFGLLVQRLPRHRDEDDDGAVL